jgi:hypothetical protein
MAELSHGDRVVLHRDGRRWPGQVRGRPWTANPNDGTLLVRVQFDSGSAGSVPVENLTAEEED